MVIRGFCSLEANRCRDKRKIDTATDHFFERLAVVPRDFRTVHGGFENRTRYAAPDTRIAREKSAAIKP